MLEEIFRLIGEFVEEYRAVLIVAITKIFGLIHQHHPALYAALVVAALVVAAFAAGLLILQTWHFLSSWRSTLKKNRSGGRNIELGGEPTMEKTGENAKSGAITGEQWRRVFEAIAWAAVAAFAMVLLQAREVDRWDTDGKVGLLVVVLLFGVAMTYLREMFFSQSRRLKSVEAESFVLKRDGLVLAQLELGEGTFGPGPSFTLYDLTGALQAKLALGLLESSLVLYDCLGNQRIKLGVTGIAPENESDNQIIRIFDADGKVIWSAP